MYRVNPHKRTGWEATKWQGISKIKVQQQPGFHTLTFAWAKSNGLEISGEVYFQYLNDEEQPESEYLTVMAVPVK